MNIVVELATILAPVFVVAGIGYTWSRAKMPFDSVMLTALMTNIGAPCLVFTSLTKFEVSTAVLGHVALAAALCGIGFAVLGRIVLAVMKLPTHSYLPALIFPNAGNLGLSVCLFAFGQPGLALGIGCFAVASFSQFTVGAAIAAGDWSPRQLLRTPIIYALALALVFVISGVHPPRWLHNTTDLLGGMTIPLMLFALGVSLAQLRVTRLPMAALLSVVRLGGGFLIGLGVTWALGLDPLARGVVIIEATMPTAVFNYLFAVRYNREPADVAGIVVISTVMSFVILPFLLLLVLP